MTTFCHNSTSSNFGPKSYRENSVLLDSKIIKLKCHPILRAILNNIGLNYYFKKYDVTICMHVSGSGNFNKTEK